MTPALLLGVLVDVVGVLAEIVKPEDGHADDDNDAVLG